MRAEVAEISAIRSAPRGGQCRGGRGRSASLT